MRSDAIQAALPLRAWRRRTLLVVAAATAVCALAPAARAAGDRYTPVVMSVVSTPRWFDGADDRVHLVYELRLTNGIPVPVTVTGLSVRAASGSRIIERLTGDDLAAATSQLTSPGEPDTAVPPSGTSVVWLDIPLRNRRAIPRRLRHTLTVSVPPGLPVPTTITHTGGKARVDRRPPVVLGPPLRGDGWIAAGSCCDGPHRRALQPVNGALWLGQRFAVDWNAMNPQGRWVVGDPAVNTNWIFYGKPVIAVADARVVAAVDRFPDQIPNNPEPVTLEQADGNHVIVDLGGGRYAFYAHLAPGSVRVRRGDRIRRGEQIARLGNSGSSSGPHLHFHVMNRPSPVASDGLPFVIDRFRLAGRIPPIDAELEQTINAGEPVPIDPEGAGVQRRTLPLGRDVVDFAGR